MKRNHTQRECAAGNALIGHLCKSLCLMLDKFEPQPTLTALQTLNTSLNEKLQQKDIDIKDLQSSTLKLQQEMADLNHRCVTLQHTLLVSRADAVMPLDTLPPSPQIPVSPGSQSAMFWHNRCRKTEMQLMQARALLQAREKQLAYFGSQSTPPAST